jgi:hypothetical protein
MAFLISSNSTFLPIVHRAIKFQKEKTVSNLQDTEINNLLSESVAKIAIVPLVLGAGEQLFSILTCDRLTDAAIAMCLVKAST